MACLNTLKQEIRTLESIFSKSHERFQIVSASVDELSCRFIGKNGKKYAIHANITVSRCYKTYSILLTAKKGLGGLIFCKFSSNKGSYPSCFFLTFNICSSDSCVCHFCCHFKKVIFVCIIQHKGLSLQETYPSVPPVWFADSEETSITNAVQILSNTEGLDNHVLHQVIILLKELCRLHAVPEPPDLDRLQILDPQTTNR